MLPLAITMTVQENIPLAPHTTFKIGGKARYFISVESIDDLRSALAWAQEKKIPYFILAGGSNVLIADTGFDGVVIKMELSAVDIDLSTNECLAEAGSSLMDVIHTVCNAGLSGMESMYGIPGTVGGAVRGNAGAFGTEVVDVLASTTALNVNTQEVRVFTNEECEFGYRTSFFKKNPEWIILSVIFALEEADPQECLAKAQATLDTRNERQIQDICSAGSFFMNPVAPKEVQEMFETEKGTPVREERVPAGWLIDKAGFKGVCEKDVCTGERSANYLINTDNARAQDVLALAQRIKERVKDEFNVELSEEVTHVGF